MMEKTGQQTTADDRMAGSEATSGESELDTLLKEYETDRKPDTSNGDLGRVLKHLEPVVDYAKSSMQEKQQEAVDSDIAKAYEFMSEADELKALKPTHIRGFMEAYAVENPLFAKAFQDRGKNPEAWNGALEKGRDWLKDQIGGLSQSEAKSDLEAAKAAVSGTTDSVPLEREGPSVSEMFAMSDTKFKSLMDAELAKAAG